MLAKREPKVGDFVRRQSWSMDWFYEVLRIEGAYVYLNSTTTNKPLCYERDAPPDDPWVFWGREGNALPDWSKPIEYINDKGETFPARLLCKDADRTRGDAYCVLYHHPSGNDYTVFLMPDGTFAVRNGEGWPVIRNVPKKPESKSYDLVMHTNEKTGSVVVGKHPVGWEPKFNKVLARKTVTITEGEGI